MPFDVSEYRDKHPELYGDSSLKEVAQDLFDFNPQFQSTYKDVDDWAERDGLKASWETDEQNVNAIRHHRQMSLERQQNLDDMNFITRSVARGYNQTQAMLGGALGIGGDLVGSDALKEYGLETYRKNTEEASLYPGTVWKDVQSAPMLMKPVKAGQWALELLGEQVPNIAGAMAASIATGGLATGAMATGIGASALAGTARNKIVQKALGGVLSNSVRKQLAGSGLIKKLATRQGLSRADGLLLQTADQAVVKNIAQRVAAKGGLVGFTTALEGGGMYGEGADAGFHNPVSALGLGVLAGMVEVMGGNVRIIDKILGRKTGKLFSKKLDDIANAKAQKGDVSLVSRIWREALKQAPAEAGQEAVQESLALANHVVANNDPGFELLSMENLKRVGEAAVSGGVVGTFFGAGTGALNFQEAIYDYDKTDGTDPDVNRAVLDHAAAKGKIDAATKIASGELEKEDAPVSAEKTKPTDRRADVETRSAVSEILDKWKKGEKITKDERQFLKDKIYKDELTGLLNRRAFDDSKKAPEVASLDVAGLKWVNDNYGQEVGDELLKRMGDALNSTSLKDRAHHISGDEFLLQADKEADLDIAIGQAEKYLEDNPLEITKKDGTTETVPVKFSYGKGKTSKEATEGLVVAKKERKSAGKIPERGEKPTDEIVTKPEEKILPEEKQPKEPEAEITPPEESAPSVTEPIPVSRETKPEEITEEPKPLTKKQKSQAELDKYYSGLSEEQRESVKNIYEKEPASPGAHKLKLQKALAKKPEEAAKPAEIEAVEEAVAPPEDIPGVVKKWSPEKKRTFEVSKAVSRSATPIELDEGKTSSDRIVEKDTYGGPEQTVEFFINQIKVGKDVANEASGRLSRGGKAAMGETASPTEMLKNWADAKQRELALEEWKKQYPEGWDDYQKRQKEVSNLKAGDKVTTPLGAAGIIKRKNKVNWSIQSDDNIAVKWLYPPESLQPVAEEKAEPERQELPDISDLDIENITVTYKEQRADRPNKQKTITESADVAVKKINERLEKYYEMASCLGIRL